MIFQAIEVLVAFPACLALVRFVLFHALGAGVGLQGFGVDYAEGAVGVGV